MTTLLLIKLLRSGTTYWQASRDARTFTRSALNCERSPWFICPFAHRMEAEMTGERSLSIKAQPIISHRQDQLSIMRLQMERHRTSLSMLNDIMQRLLRNAIQR